MDLDQLRKQIDDIDDQLLQLLNKRMDFVKQVGELKRATASVIYRPEREKQILKRLSANNHGLLNDIAIEAIFLEIFAVSRNLELPEKVAFLGPEGSFTHQAAEGRFGAMSEYLVLPTIRSIFDSVDTGRAKFGVVPFENNQEGVVPETADLLREKELLIVADLYLPIHFSLASNQDSLHRIKKVYSKDIAFRQCSKFIREYLEELEIELVPVESTSRAARLAAQEEGTAAICSHISAKLFSVPILYENIEDSTQNRTRFLVLARNILNRPSQADKTTLIANLPNTERPGALYHFLKDFNDRGINLTKIESRPKRNGAGFGFWFLVEVEGHMEDPALEELLTKYAGELKCLGSFVDASK